LGFLKEFLESWATWAPTDSEMYRENGKRLAEEGYVLSTDRLPAEVQR
jgi:hypothetical protein